MKQVSYIGKDQNVVAQLADCQGIELRQFDNGLAFSNAIRHNYAPDLVMIEKRLQGVQGEALIKLLKQEVDNPMTLFALVQDKADRKEKLQLLFNGVHELFLKPVVTGDLELRIDWLRSIQNGMMSNHVHASSELKKLTPSKEYRIPLAKRIFDLAIAGTALLLLSPILILVILAIRLESKGPIFYISKRVGTGYQIFDFYKFRSMYADADRRLREFKHLNQYAQATVEESEQKSTASVKDHQNTPTLIHKDGTPLSEAEYLEIRKQQSAGTFVKIANDPRVTKVGAFLRNTSIDELPQLINVIKGDMSIVGNRPLPLYEAEMLTSDDWGERFLAPAGITGLWQVVKRGKSEMSEEERKHLDNQYAQNFSIWNDIVLILRTIPALFQKENV